MFISPITAINSGWISHPQCNSLQDYYDRNFICPNAMDITVDVLFSVNPESRFFISEDARIMRQTSKMIPDTHKRAPEFSQFDEAPLWFMDTGYCYDGMSDFKVNVPNGIAAMLVPRSSFNRNGTFIMSGLYDSGFNNNIGFMIYNMGGKTLLAQHTRIGQIIFVKSETSGMLYSGVYNQNQGNHWSSINAGQGEHKSFRSGDGVGDFAVDPTKSEFL